jgi:DNA-binding NarL/FixJ family response regulator
LPRAPLVVVLDSPPHLADELSAAREQGFQVVPGWGGGVGDVCTGTVVGAEDAAAALLAVVAGAGLVADVDAPDELVDRLCDDLRRFGRVDVRTPASPRRPSLTRLQRELLTALAAGRTLAAAAQELELPRRTADRRLAEARAALGVETTAEAIVVFQTARS